MKIHPAAEAWPMLPDDELAALADSIAANGLRHPITTWRGQVVDGRNRLAACERAGVEPSFVEADFPDEAAVVAFIVDENEKRRHLNKGQRAVALARLYAPNGRWGQGEQARVLKTFKNSPKPPELTKAAFVVGNAPDLANRITTGAIGLTAAYDEAKARQRLETSDQTRMERLRTEAPDLAALVDDDQLTAAEAIASLEERLAEERRQRTVATKLIDDTFGGILSLLNGQIELDTLADHYVAKYDGPLTASDFTTAAQFAQAIATRKDT